MTSSTDSNIFISMWDRDAGNLAARRALDAAMAKGQVVTSGAVYAELMAGAGRSREMLDTFFDETGIAIDWEMDRTIWQIAGIAYQGYAERRRTQKAGAPRRLMTDFLIGAHAVRHGFTLVTSDRRLYSAAFPTLKIISAQSA